jgi:hypothetical protein
MTDEQDARHCRPLGGRDRNGCSAGPRTVVQISDS